MFDAFLPCFFFTVSETETETVPTYTRHILAGEHPFAAASTSEKTAVNEKTAACGLTAFVQRCA